MTCTSKVCSRWTTLCWPLLSKAQRERERENNMDWQPGWDLHIGAASTAGMPCPLPEGHRPSDPATEIMEDMALLEQVLAQLVGGDEGAVPDTDRLALDV